MSGLGAPGQARSRGAAGRQWVAGREVGLVYAAIVVVVAAGLAVSPASTAERFILDSSTNLVNLREHPPYVLVVSAFVVPSAWQLWILLPLVWVYGCVQKWLGRAGVIVVAVIGHIGATLVVATLLAAGIVHGRFSLAEAHAADVGVSYGLVSAIALLTARLSTPRRRLAEAAGTMVALLALVVDRSFTDLGHVAAWLIGLGLALLVRRGGDAAAVRL